MTTTNQELMVIPKGMIDNLHTSQCAGIIVDTEAYKALMQFVEKQPPVQFKPHDFDWPPTSRELSSMDRFCGGPSHEDYDAATYKRWIKPKVDSLIGQLNTALAATDHYRNQVEGLDETVRQLQIKLTWGSVKTVLPEHERAKFEAYAREKGLRVDVAIWNMSEPPQFKEYCDPEAQAEWIHWCDIRGR